MHLIECLDLGLSGTIPFLVLLALFGEQPQLFPELRILPLEHHDHLVFLVLEHLNKNYNNEILSLNLNISIYRVHQNFEKDSYRILVGLFS